VEILLPLAISDHNGAIYFILEIMVSSAWPVLNNHDPRIISEYCKQFSKKEWNT